MKDQRFGIFIFFQGPYTVSGTFTGTFPEALYVTVTAKSTGEAVDIGVTDGTYSISELEPDDYIITPHGYDNVTAYNYIFTPGEYELSIQYDGFDKADFVITRELIPDE